MDQMDASVAPPRLITRALGAIRRICSGSVTGIQSPLSRTVRKAGKLAPAACAASANSCMSAGTEFHTVTRCSATRSSQEAGSGCPAAGSTRVAPAATAPKMS